MPMVCALDGSMTVPWGRAVHVSAVSWPVRHRTTLKAAYSSASYPPARSDTPPPRFYAQHLPASVGSTVELDPDESRHAVKVLRLQPGQALELCDGAGGVVACQVLHSDKSSTVVAATAAPVQLPWRGPRWVVAAGCLTLKGGRADWLVEKATELGALALVPLVTERSQAAGKAKFKTEGDGFQAGRLERLALAATKQCLRAHALRLEPPTQLAALLPRLRAAPLALVATAGAPPAGAALHAACGGGGEALRRLCEGECLLVVGPEGDLTPDELSQLMAAGAAPVGLGANRLRTETAAVALLAGAAAYADAAAATTEPP